MANNIQVQLDLLLKGNKEVASSLKSLEGNAGSLKRAFETAAGVFAGSAALGAVKSFASTLSSTISQSIELAKQQEDAVNRLNVALAQSGSFSRAVSKDFQSFASSLQQASIVGDEVILNQLALAKSFEQQMIKQNK